jgi:hypothetical protein
MLSALEHDVYSEWSANIKKRNVTKRQCDSVVCSLVPSVTNIMDILEAADM